MSYVPQNHTGIDQHDKFCGFALVVLFIHMKNGGEFHPTHDTKKR